jgi:TIGR02594 family protein|nr:MAG TPA: Tail associated lysozyme [Caudoviricetes sp.]
MDLKGWIKGAFNIDRLVKPSEPAKVETPKVEPKVESTPAPKPAAKVEETKPTPKPTTTPTAKPTNGQLEELPWIAELRKHIGLAEIKGPRHNPTIIQWLKDMGKYSGENKSWYYEDESAWCGLAVGHALGVSGRFVVPEWFRALKWSDEKYLTKLDKPAYGCIGVKERKGGGHVFFVVGLISPGYVACLGGNQGDKVSIIPIAIKDIKGFYWPSKWENKQCVKQTPNPLRYDLKIVSATGRLGASEA